MGETLTRGPRGIRRRERWRRPDRVGAQAASWAVCVAEGRESRRERARARLLSGAAGGNRMAIGAVVASCLAAIALALGWSGTGKSPHVSAGLEHSHSGLSARSGVGIPPALSARAHQASGESRTRTRVRGRSRSRGTRAVDHRNARVHSRTHASPRSPGSVAVELTTPTTPTGGSSQDQPDSGGASIPSSSTPASGASGTSSEGASNTTQQDSSSGSSNATSRAFRRAGPEGAGAPFGPGTIG